MKRTSHSIHYLKIGRKHTVFVKKKNTVKMVSYFITSDVSQKPNMVDFLEKCREDIFCAVDVGTKRAIVCVSYHNLKK